MLDVVYPEIKTNFSYSEESCVAHTFYILRKIYDHHDVLDARNELVASQEITKEHTCGRVKNRISQILAGHELSIVKFEHVQIMKPDDLLSGAQGNGVTINSDCVVDIQYV